MHFAQQGNTFTPHDNTRTIMHATLPAGTYMLKFHPERGLYLDVVDDFTMPSKVYGTVAKDADRILATYASRDGMTGALLEGEKGSGKTLMAKQVSAKALAAGMPTILVNQGYAGDMFSEFVQGMHQPAVFLMDEFEKTHDPKSQQALLTLMDGVMTSKKLFLLTVNEIGKLSEFLTNRPGRLFYHFNFNGLTTEFIREFATDVLKDNSKANVDGVVAASLVAGMMNFDQLSALIQEMNRYNENVADAVKHLNISPRSQVTFCKVDIKTNTGVPLTLNNRQETVMWDPMGGGVLDLALKIVLPIVGKEARARYTAMNRDPDAAQFDFNYTGIDGEELIDYDLATGVFNYFIPMDYDNLSLSSEYHAQLGKGFTGVNVTVTHDKAKAKPTMHSMLKGIAAQAK